MATDELIARYDADGTSVGTCPGPGARAKDSGNAATAVLTDRATANDPTCTYAALTRTCFPSCHDCWAGGVVAAAETPDECARRRNGEELGVPPVSLQRCCSDFR